MKYAIEHAGKVIVLVTRQIYRSVSSRVQAEATSKDTLPVHQIFPSAGGKVSGEYTVKDPGGSLRVVSYQADKEGFHAVVHTSGKNDHSGGVYGGQGHDVEGHLHEYVAALASY
jgi:predicted lactoylglutathione lyase